MGRLRVLNDPKEPDPQHPSEPTDGGCPGAWYRCDWVFSVMPYERMMTEGGGFSENLRLSRSSDPLILDAVQYLEQQRIRSSNYDQAKQAERLRAKP